MDMADDIPEEVPSADDGQRTPSANNEDVGFTLEDFTSLLSKYDYHFKPGDVVNGTVFNLEPKGALIDIGAKTAAFMPLPEVSINRVETLEDVLEPGETREFFILSEENEDGQLSLSIRRIEYQMPRANRWQRLPCSFGTNSCKCRLRYVGQPGPQIGDASPLVSRSRHNTNIHLRRWKSA